MTSPSDPIERPILAPSLLAAIAGGVGTPVVRVQRRRDPPRLPRLDLALASLPARLHYALKANSTLAVVRLLRTEGAGADANSSGEIEVALRAGFIPDRDRLHRRRQDRRRARSRRHAGPQGDQRGIGRRARADRRHAARAQDATARVALRVNPDIDARSHPHISTGLRTNKFGMPVDAGAADLPRRTRASRGSSRSGCTCTSARRSPPSGPWREPPRAWPSSPPSSAPTASRSSTWTSAAGSASPTTARRPRPRRNTPPPCSRPWPATGLTLIVEPGRALVGAAGLLLARVIDLKTYGTGPALRGPRRGHVGAAAPGPLRRVPSHRAVSPRDGASRPYEVVGPVCESSDIVGRDRLLPPLEVGDLVAILDAGAYGSAMASNYNRHPLPAGGARRGRGLARRPAPPDASTTSWLSRRDACSC